MKVSQSQLLDIEVTIHRETEKAIKVSSADAVSDEVWLPLSQVEINTRHGDSAEITLPRWLAEERGLA